MITEAELGGVAEGAVHPANSGERLPAVRAVHPGDILRNQFLPDFGITVYRLAVGLGISQTHAHNLVHERRNVTAELALRLARYFGTTPEFWLVLQEQYDLETARTPEFVAELAAMQPHPEAVTPPEQVERVLRGRTIPVVPPF